MCESYNYDSSNSYIGNYEIPYEYNYYSPNSQTTLNPYYNNQLNNNYIPDYVHYLNNQNNYQRSVPDYNKRTDNIIIREPINNKIKKKKPWYKRIRRYFRKNTKCF